MDCAICAKYGKNFTGAIKQKVVGTSDIRAAKIIVEELQLPITPEDYVELLNESKLVLDDLIILPGVEKLINHLHKNKIPMAVASGASNYSYQLYSKKYAKLFSLFHHVVLVDSDPDIKRGKPAPDVFLVCAQRFPDQPLPNKCLVFEDSPYGVKAAVRAGMQVVMVPDDYVSDHLKQEATLVLNSLENFHPEWFGLHPYSGSVQFPINGYKPVTHVIFDMDGLLLNTEAYYYNISRAICKKYGKNFTKKLKLKITGSSSIRGSKIVVEELQLPISPEDYAKQCKEAKESILPSNVMIMPGAEKLIRHLHKNRIPMAVGSGQSTTMYRLVSQKYEDLFSLFHHVLLGDSNPDIKFGKPAPDIFLVCAKRFPNPPSSSKCLVFEDSPNGVAAAVKAGMQVVMVPPDYVSDDLKQEATLVLNSLEDFHPESFGLPPYSDV